MLTYSKTTWPTPFVIEDVVSFKNTGLFTYEMELCQTCKVITNDFTQQWVYKPCKFRLTKRKNGLLSWLMSEIYCEWQVIPEPRETNYKILNRLYARDLWINARWYRLALIELNQDLFALIAEIILKKLSLI